MKATIRLLDELREVCGYDREYAIKLLAGEPATIRCKVGRKPVYAKEVIAMIKSTLSFGTFFIGEQRRACLFGGSTPQCLLAVSFAEANF